MENQTGAEAKVATAAAKPERRHRSPSYPALALGECLRLVKILFEKERKHMALFSVIAGHWSYSSKSSGALLAVAACKKFGLLNEERSGDKRMLGVSDTAVALLNPANPNGPQLFKDAALKPEIFSELWAKYGGNLPSDQTINAFLVFERGFAEDAARSALTTFKETIAFAKLQLGDSVKETDTVGEAPADQSDQDKNKDSDTRMQTNLQPPAGQTNQQQQVAMREFPVPLYSGAIASFKVPHPMSEEDYDLYTKFLEVLKPGLVRSKT